MLNRLFSGSAPQRQAGAVDDATFLDQVLVDGPEADADAVPDYVAEVPRDIPRHEYVGLTKEERKRYVRPERPITGRGLSDEIADSFGTVIDRMVLDPIRMVFGNMGFIVTGAAVLALVTMVAVWIMDVIMAPFGG